MRARVSMSSPARPRIAAALVGASDMAPKMSSAATAGPTTSSSLMAS
jgi:hypothetical protein